MKRMRQSTLAVLIALVSTAALGPGTFFAQSPDQAMRRPLRSIAAISPDLHALEAFLWAALPESAAGVPLSPLADAALEDAGFLAIDFGQHHAGKLSSAAGGVIAAAGRDERGFAGHAGVAAGRADAAADGTQLAGSSGMQIAGIGPLSGLNAVMAPAGPSAIRLDDPGLTGEITGTLPMLALAPGLDHSGAGLPGSGASAPPAEVPEPATMLLTGLGVLGLLAARRTTAGPASLA